ncbi:MAG: tail fiber domain-containing protein [Acetobacteraceae bacterium]|nr:tail fiber domain-containing protein [Acetobacteraceae bacterium]
MPFDTSAPSCGPINPDGEAGIAPPVFSNYAIQCTVGAQSYRQFLIFAEATAEGTTTDTVAGYFSFIGHADSANGWAINTVVTLRPEYPKTSSAQGIQLDFNNECQDYWTAPGPAGLASGPFASGLSLTGVSTFPIGTAIWITGATGTVQQHRGVTVSNADQAAFCDYSQAQRALEVYGVKQYAVDTGNMSGGNPMRINNNSAIYSRNAENTTDFQIVGSLANDCAFIGDASTFAVYSKSNFVPLQDATRFLGLPNNRWSAVYSVNGVVQTSDVRLKTDVDHLPECLPIVLGVQPISFRWLDHPYTNLRHYGFSAQNVKKIMPPNFAGHQLSGDGVHLLNQLEMFPVLWKAVQELTRRVKELEASTEGSKSTPLRLEMDRKNPR